MTEALPPTEADAGYTWTPDTRITDAAGDDTAALIEAGRDNNLTLFWQSDRGGSYAYFRADVDPFGVRTANDTFVSGRAPDYGRARALYGSPLGTDSHGATHLSFNYDDQNIGYAKFDARGNVLVPETKVGPVDAYASHIPSLTVGVDDTVHITSLDYKFQCEDLFYHHLANDGTPIWTNRVLSWDVASFVGSHLLKVDPNTGAFLFTFGSNSGTWLSRMDKYGIKDMASVSLFSGTNTQLADVAETPDGNIHAVWDNGGGIYYSRVNSTGGFLVDQAKLTTAGNAAAGPPRVAALPDNRVVIVWDDARGGARQVYFAVVNETLSMNGDVWTVPPQNRQLTNSSGDALMPWVAAGSLGQFYVIWTDTRDGNPEVYFKATFGCGARLSVTGDDLVKAMFLKPNETGVLPVKLHNLGALPDDYRLELGVSPGAEYRGWSASLSHSTEDAVPGGGTVDFYLVVRAPAQGALDEKIDAEVTANATPGTGCGDALHASFFVQVERGVSLRAVAPTATADNGDSVMFTLLVTNTGEVREDSIIVEAGAPQAPPGWVAVANASALALDPGETTLFTVSVAVPSDPALAPGGVPGRIGVTIHSAADPRVSSAAGLVVEVNSHTSVAMEPDQFLREGAPGGLVVYDIKVGNKGNVITAARIGLDSQSPAYPGWAASLDRDTLFLEGGQSTHVLLTVAIPVGARAGMNLTTVVQAFARESGSTALVEVTTRVAHACGFEAEVSANSQLDPSGAAVFLVDVSNGGNLDQPVELSLPDLPVGWNAGVSYGAGPVTNFTLAPRGAAALTVTIKPAARPLWGPNEVTFVLDASGCGAKVLALRFLIPAHPAVSLSAENTTASAPLGGDATYELGVHNEGNGGADVPLDVRGLPDLFEFAFAETFPSDPTGRQPEAIGGSLPMPAYSEKHVRLTVHVPANASARFAEFDLWSEIAGGDSVAIGLRLAVVLPDVAVVSLELAPPSARLGEPVQVVVQLQNLGSATAPGGTLHIYVDGAAVINITVPAMVPGRTIQTSWDWHALPGGHRVRAVFNMSGAAGEANLTNNAVEATWAFGAPAAPAGSAYSFDSSFVITGAIIAAAAVALALIARAPGRRPPIPYAPGDVLPFEQVKVPERAQPPARGPPPPR